MPNVKEYSVKKINIARIPSKDRIQIDEIQVLKGELPMEVSDSKMKLLVNIPPDKN